VNEPGFYTAIVVAAFGGIISLLALAANAIISGRRNRITRQTQEFSKAFAACVAYEEFPYIVRRRSNNAPQDERIRISTDLSIIQRELAYYTAWLSTESSDVSTAYENLVSKLREVVGVKIHEAWLTPPIESDSDMNITDLEFKALIPLKTAYLHAVAHHLSSWHR